MTSGAPGPSNREQRVVDVQRRILEAREQDPTGILAFDCDGTLWSGDVGEDAFLARVGTMHDELGPISALATRELSALVRQLELTVSPPGAGGTSHGDEGAVFAHALFQGYLEERVGEELMCEVMTWIYAGWTHEQMSAFVDSVVRGKELASRIHAEASAIGAWAHEVGIPVFLVSASPVGVIRTASTLLGWPVTGIVAATPSESEGRITAGAQRPIPYGAGKVQRLNEHTGGLPVLAAFGDNVFDLAMLLSSRVPAAIRPKPRLREQLASHPDIVILVS